MLYYELLPTGTTVTAIVYVAQLQKLACVIQKERPKRDKVLLLHDNARPHVAKMTRQTIFGTGLGSFTPSSVFSGLGPFRLSLIPGPQESPAGQGLRRSSTARK